MLTRKQMWRRCKSFVNINNNNHNHNDNHNNNEYEKGNNEFSYTLKREKKVHFGKIVNVILIPTRYEYPNYMKQILLRGFF